MLFDSFSSYAYFLEMTEEMVLKKLEKELL